MLSALTSCGELLLSYGGHSMAAGFCFDAARLDEVYAALTQHADGSLTDDDLIPEVVADGVVTPREVTETVVSELEDMRPYGDGNPPPLFLGRGVTLLQVEPTRNTSHPRVTLRGEGTNPIYGMAFGLGEVLSEYRAGEEVEILFEPTYDTWQGRRRLRWYLRDVRRPELAENTNSRYAVTERADTGN